MECIFTRVLLLVLVSLLLSNHVGIYVSHGSNCVRGWYKRCVRRSKRVASDFGRYYNGCAFRVKEVQKRKTVDLQGTST